MRALPEAVSVALLAAAGCSLIDVDALSRGEGDTGGATGSTSGAETSASTASTTASAAQASTVVATATTEAVSASASTGCVSFCSGVTATHCFDFDGPNPTRGFVTNDFNGLGTLGVADSPTDPACSRSLVCDLTGFQDPNVATYYQHGHAFDISTITQRFRLAFKTYTEVAAPFTSIAVLSWDAAPTRCQAIMMLGDDGSPYARFFMQSRNGDGPWSFDVERVVRLDTTFVGRWLSYQLDITALGGLAFALTADDATEATATFQHACATPSAPDVMLWLGANYTSSPQTSYFDDLVVDIL